MENGKTCGAADGIFNHRPLGYIAFYTSHGGNGRAYAKACVQQHKFLDRLHATGSTG